MADAAARIAAAAGRPVTALKPLAGGCIAEVYRAEFAVGTPLVAKVGRAGDGLDLEGWMLERLAAHDLPVPAVSHAADDLLLMSWIDSGGRLDTAAQEHAADLLAALHGVTGPHFGLERDTLIGPLPQPNPPSARWLPFFAEHRLLYMAGLAHDAGRLPAATVGRIEALAGRLERWLDEPARPALIHGDVWDGNVLVAPGGGRIAGFIDPAIYFADPEIELAFASLFNTLGERFFRRYQEHRPLAPGFFEVRRDLYNLYPLLVHTRLFGGSYGASVSRILDRLGV